MATKKPELLVQVVSAECKEYIRRMYDLTDSTDLMELFSISITQRRDGKNIFTSTMVIENIDGVFCSWELIPLLEATMKAIIHTWLLHKGDTTGGELIKTAMKLCEEFPAMAATARLKGRV